MNFKTTNQHLYLQALKHKSVDKKLNNERLEFLGDAVLNLTVSKYLFEQYKDAEEGFLSQKRAAFVSRKQLNKIGEKLINKLDLKHNTQQISPNMYGNTLEAIIGAIYIDQGIKYTEDFVKNQIIRELDVKSTVDWKSLVTIWGQKNKSNIKFRLAEEKGPPHKKQYLIELYFNKIKKSEAWSSTIKEAEQKAAKAAHKYIIN